VRLIRIRQVVPALYQRMAAPTYAFSFFQCREEGQVLAGRHDRMLSRV